MDDVAVIFERRDVTALLSAVKDEELEELDGDFWEDFDTSEVGAKSGARDGTERLVRNVVDTVNILVDDVVPSLRTFWASEELAIPKTDGVTTENSSLFVVVK